MFRVESLADRLLEALAGSEVFAAYCTSRGVPFEPPSGELFSTEDHSRWREALAGLSPARRAGIELELAQVSNLAHRDAIQHLLDACGRKGYPAELVAGEAAQALWFLLHRPEVFLEVHFHEEVSEVASWRNAATTPGLDVSDHDAARAALDAELRRSLRLDERSGHFCASRSHRFSDPDCHVFVGFISEPIRFVEAFTDAGEQRRQRIRPAAELYFAYYPSDGTVLLKSRYRRRETVLDLFRGFARAVLGTRIDEASLDFRFNLEQLKHRFDPPRPPDVLSVRVRALELGYPPGEGRRRIRFETGADDGPDAIPILLRNHLPPGDLADRLAVVQADLQLLLRGPGRPRTVTVRLWPNRCALDRNQEGELIRLCLHSWGLAHAPEP